MQGQPHENRNDIDLSLCNRKFWKWNELSQKSIMHLPSCFIFTGCQHKPAMLWWTWEWFYSHDIFRALQLGIEWVPHSSQFWLLYLREGAAVSFSSNALPCCPTCTPNCCYTLQLVYEFEVYLTILNYASLHTYHNRCSQKSFVMKMQKVTWKCHWRTLSFFCKDSTGKAATLFLLA